MADSSQPTMSGGSNTQPQPAPSEQPSSEGQQREAVEMKPVSSTANHPLGADDVDDTAAAGPTTPAKDEPKNKDSLSIDDAPAEDGGPSSSGPAGSTDGGPVCNITLLLPTGARHPYRIDERYLAKRGVEMPEATEDGKKDPFSISVYKLKELILREWRDEWDGKPASPSSIRLIHFGKLLEDKELLKKYQFSAEAPNVVHMSVRPAEMMEEDEAAKGKGGGRDGRSREGGRGCCVIL